MPRHREEDIIRETFGGEAPGWSTREGGSTEPSSPRTQRVRSMPMAPVFLPPAPESEALPTPEVPMDLTDPMVAALHTAGWL